jgi:hypothetical protein
MSKNPELVDTFLKVLIEGIAVFKTNKSERLHSSAV